jgi:hypothetical protein
MSLKEPSIDLRGGASKPAWSTRSNPHVPDPASRPTCRAGMARWLPAAPTRPWCPRPCRLGWGEGRSSPARCGSEHNRAIAPAVGAGASHHARRQGGRETDSGRKGKAREREVPPPPSLSPDGLPCGVLPCGGTPAATRWREGGRGTRSGGGGPLRSLARAPYRIILGPSWSVVHIYCYGVNTTRSIRL